MIENKHDRIFCDFLTPIDIFKEFIFPEIKPMLTKYRWIDLFAGKGNLILPILEYIPPSKRKDFFEEHIFLCDVQPEMVNYCIQQAVKLGIPEKLARKNIRINDSLKEYPKELLNSKFPIFHITNPPFLYIGNITKNPKLHFYLDYFKGENKGYQDLYQIALINDLRNNIEKMIYILPTNFLFGNSISNKVRKDFLNFYKIEKAIIFEKQVFDFTGTHVAIYFFNRKENPSDEIQEFKGIKINNEVKNRTYRLLPSFNYRAGSEFEIWTIKHKSRKPLKIKFYLYLSTIENNKGEYKITLVDANEYVENKYSTFTANVNEKLYRLIKSNPLFLRTLDKGTLEKRTGLYLIPEEFNADGIVVKKPYRTHPIQLFIEPTLSYEDILLLKDYFNLLLEHFRKITDSEFMTTYKYSNAEYTRKFLGLKQAKSLIETFPYLELSEPQKEKLRELVSNKDIDEILKFLEIIHN